jgi:hypothetical protein
MGFIFGAVVRLDECCGTVKSTFRKLNCTISFSAEA